MEPNVNLRTLTPTDTRSHNLKLHLKSPHEEFPSELPTSPLPIKDIQEFKKYKCTMCERAYIKPDD